MSVFETAGGQEPGFGAHRSGAASTRQGQEAGLQVANYGQQEIELAGGSRPSTFAQQNPGANNDANSEENKQKIRKMKSMGCGADQPDQEAYIARILEKHNYNEIEALNEIFS